MTVPMALDAADHERDAVCCQGAGDRLAGDLHARDLPSGCEIDDPDLVLEAVTDEEPLPIGMRHRGQGRVSDGEASGYDPRRGVDHNELARRHADPAVAERLVNNDLFEAATGQFPASQSYAAM